MTQAVTGGAAQVGGVRGPCRGPRIQGEEVQPR
jgi:hypothetical protein